ncbi:MAG: hypothetical protein NT167_26635, partial [Verrucomicrobia bacterium]|nr:hypothetical protein [Verrucomicrobiota bacterium]
MRIKSFTALATLALAGWLGTSLVAAASRTTQSLDGQWQIEECASPTEIPVTFTHTGPVPGLANLARPAFKDVDLF